MSSGFKSSVNLCPICVEEISSDKIAKIDSCSHSFCYPCIWEWGTNHKNYCPLCKKKFENIEKKDDFGNFKKEKVVLRVNIENSSDEESEYSDDLYDFEQCHDCEQ